MGISSTTRGKLPSPEQIRILPITDEQIDFAKSVAKDLTRAGIRVTVADRADMGAKIREARNDRDFAVVRAGTVSLQKQNGDKLGSRTVAELIEQLSAEIAAREAEPAATAYSAIAAVYLIDYPAPVRHARGFRHTLRGTGD